MSNSLDPDQARPFVGHDLGPNCLPRLSADGTGRQRVNELKTTSQKLSCNGKNDVYVNTDRAAFFDGKRGLGSPSSGVKMVHMC